MPRLDSALSALRGLDTLAARDTALSRVDARAQLLTTLLFIITLLSRDRYSVAALLPLALYPMVLATQGQVPLRTLGYSLWLAAPFALMVGAFNPLLEPQPLLRLADVAVSAGWVSLAAIVLRAVLSVAATVVLVAGTGMLPLCAALARLGVPQVLTTQLLLLQRYVVVLVGEAQRMNTARQLRGGPAPMSLVTYGSLLGHLLLRALDRAQRVHQAMLARGYTGVLPGPALRGWRWADTRFIVGWSLYFLVLRLVDVPQALGGWLARALT